MTLRFRFGLSLKRGHPCTSIDPDNLQLSESPHGVSLQVASNAPKQVLVTVRGDQRDIAENWRGSFAG